MGARIVATAESGAIEEAAEIIREGGLVAFPTETVYGLGADACNALAVARVFEVKQRPSIDPLIVHVADLASAASLGEIPERWAGLLDRFWPGPLTIVVPRREAIPLIVTAGLETVALRMPAHPAALALLRRSGRAIAAPSANPFGYVSPTCAQHVADLLADRIDLILDGGPSTIGLESTIISLVESKPRILRAGGLPPEEIAPVFGELSWDTPATDRPRAPGQLERHYATRTPLEIHSPGDPRALPRRGERVGLVTLGEGGNGGNYARVEVLSRSRDLREAAANLFAALRRLDRMELDRLVAHPVPEQGLGLAIMDRLRRCSAR